MPITANVPYGQGVPTVSAEIQQPNDYLNVAGKDNPTTFGANIGQAMEQSGKAAEQFGSQAFHLADEAAQRNAELWAMDANTKGVQQMTKIWGDFGNSEGMDAVAKHEAYQTAIMKTYQDFVDSAPSPVTKVMLAQSLKQYTDWYQRAGQSHTSAQTKVVQDNIVANNIDNTITQANVFRNDLDAMERLVNAAGTDAKALAFSRFAGTKELRDQMDPDHGAQVDAAVNNAYLETRGKAAFNIVKTGLAENDITGAANAYSRLKMIKNASGNDVPGIDGASMAQIETMLKPKLEEATAHDIALRSRAASGQPLPPGEGYMLPVNYTPPAGLKWSVASSDQGIPGQPSTGNVGTDIVTAGKSFGASNAAIMGVLNNAHAESGLNPSARGGAGEQGVFQLKPGNGRLPEFQAAYPGSTSVADQARFVFDTMEREMPGFKDITDPRQATAAVMRVFEKPADQSDNELARRTAFGSKSQAIMDGVSPTSIHIVPNNGETDMTKAGVAQRHAGALNADMALTADNPTIQQKAMIWENRFKQVDQATTAASILQQTAHETDVIGKYQLIAQQCAQAGKPLPGNYYSGINTEDVSDKVKAGLYEYANQHIIDAARATAKTYGPGFMDVINSILLPAGAQGRVNSDTDIIGIMGQHPDQLTPSGLNESFRFLKMAHDQPGQAEEIAAFLKGVKSRISNSTVDFNDPHGDMLYSKWVSTALPQIYDGLAKGKSMAELTKDDSPIVTSIPQRTSANNIGPAINQGASVLNPPDINTLEGLKYAVAHGFDRNEAGRIAIQRGWAAAQPKVLPPGDTE